MRHLFLISALAVLPCGPTAAQEVGNPEAGLAVAAEACADCHDIMLMEGISPTPAPLPFEELEAKSFEEIANTPGVTAMALFAWMQSTHPTMPDIMLKDDELRNVVAYILSLKDE